MELKMQTEPIVILRKTSRFTEGVAFSLLLFAFVQTGSAFTQSGAVLTTDGSQSDVQAALSAATNGCVVDMPTGSFNWGAGGSSVTVPAGVTLTGLGTNATVINLTSDAPTYGNGIIQLAGSGSVAENFQVQGNTSGNGTVFQATAGNGWMITNIMYYSDQTGYFSYCGGSYGLITGCVLDGENGQQELNFGRGSDNSWQTPDTFGTTNAVYIENCTFFGRAYLTDANANARYVVRFCKVNGQQKVDGHGKASNTPPRGVRQMEVYGNIWYAGGYYNAMEIRGGTAMIFDNTNTVNNYGNGSCAWMAFTEYGCQAQWASFTNTYQTPANYSVDDQIGVGEDPKVAASDPVYVWCAVGTGNENPWPVTEGAVAAGAVQLYTNQVGNPNAAFTMQNIIAPNRDYYIDEGTGSFDGNPSDGSPGVGEGSYSQMEAITPTHTSVGFWVTDLGYWNTKTTNASGELYTWNGSAWVLKYVPYTYPYPYSALNPASAPQEQQAPSKPAPPTDLRPM
jgi:hypothetical protein